MTQDEIIELARQAGCPLADMNPMYFTDKQLLSMLEAFAKLVAAKEREECAKVAEYINVYDHTIAGYIRARGEA